MTDFCTKRTQDFCWHLQEQALGGLDANCAKLLLRLRYAAGSARAETKSMAVLNPMPRISRASRVLLPFWACCGGAQPCGFGQFSQNEPKRTTRLLRRRAQLLAQLSKRSLYGYPGSTGSATPFGQIKLNRAAWCRPVANAVRVLLDCVRPDRDCGQLRNVGSTMTIDPYSALAGRKAELLHWLTEEGRFAPDTGRLLELLCDKLAALGVPIARATAHVRTLHPEYRGATRIWRRGESIEIRTTRHGIEFTSDYQNSPIQHLIETGQWLDTMLSKTTDRHFPILATLRAQGITHYVMAPLVFSNRIVNAMSWATDAPGGFAEADVELFRDLVTAFVSILEATAGRRIYGELLATYVGRDPGARIMAGAVKTGRSPSSQSSDAARRSTRFQPTA
jgi:hypothetical protein